MIRADLLWAWALLTLAVAVLAHLIFRRLERNWEGHRRRRLAHVARQGEMHAAQLLSQRGFAIEAEQVERCWPVVVAGRCCRLTLRADLLVRLGRRRYVVEVKTGNRVASIRHGPTRRQLLEYQLAFRTDGVLLVDVDRGSVLDVQFPLLGP